MGGIEIQWWIQLIVYLSSFALSATVLFTLDWKKFISPRFQNDSWPTIVYIFFSFVLAFIIGLFAITIVQIGMSAAR